MPRKKKVVEEEVPAKKATKVRTLPAPEENESIEDKWERLKDLAEQCNDALGVEGKVFTGRDVQVYERIPTGLLAFDMVTGGGLLRKRMIELYGEESSGKTLLALICTAAVQRMAVKKKTSGAVVWVEGEDFPDEDWAERQGVDLSKVMRVRALTGDKALETAATMLEEGDPDLVVHDSYQALGTTRELEGGVDQEAYAGGGSAQMWGRYYRRTRSAFNAGKTTAALIGISQVRDPIGVYSPNGKPEPRPTQIRALRHWKDIAIFSKKGEPTYLDPSSEKKRVLKREFKLKCTKNKTAPTEGRDASYVYRFRGDERGVDAVDGIIRFGKVFGVIDQRGSWLDFETLHVQGDKKLRSALEQDPKMCRRLARAIQVAIIGEE